MPNSKNAYFVYGIILGVVICHMYRTRVQGK